MEEVSPLKERKYGSGTAIVAVPEGLDDAYDPSKNYPATRAPAQPSSIPVR